MELIEARRRILLNAPHVEDTTPAGVANFQTDLISPLQSLKAGFLPVQAGSGDPSPSNVRPISGWSGLTVYKTGQNLVDQSNYAVLNNMSYSDGVFTSTNTDTNYTTLNFRVRELKNNNYLRECYVKSVVQTGVLTATFTVADPSTNRLQLKHNGSSRDIGVSFDWKLGLGTFRLTINITGINPSVLGGVVFSEIQITPESDESTYSPYTGTTIPVTFPAAGKNLACLSPYVIEQDRTSNGITYHAIDKSSVHVQGTATAGSYMIPSGQSGGTRLKAGTYTISTNLPGDNNSRVYITSETESISFHAAYNGHPVTKTISNDLNDVRVQVYVGSGITINEDIWIQIELGSTATSYEPYRNAFYGGYVDLVRGEVVATHGLADIKPANKQGTWDAQAGKGAYWYTSGIQSLQTANDGVLCNKLKVQNRVSQLDTTNCLAWYASNIIRWVELGTMEMTTDEYKAYLAEHPLIATYKLATPITYPLTPQVIKSLRGTNNIWSDANGDMSVEYWKH